MDPYFFRIRTQEYGYGRITGTGENSKEGTEYGTNTEVFENAKYGYGTDTDCFSKRMYGYGNIDITTTESQKIR